MYTIQIETFLRSRRTYVPPAGPVNCKLAIVAEQPGKHEIMAKPPKPLVGPAGKELDSCLDAVGLIRSEIYTTNVIKDLDKPLGFYIELPSKPGGIPVVSTEGYLYIEALRQELSECSANVIVAMGGIALFALTGRARGITRWRGSIIESTLLPGRKIVPIIHTATVIPPKFQQLNKFLILHDLNRAKEQQDFSEVRLTPRDIKIRPSFFDTIRYIEQCHNLGMQGARIGFDIEITNLEVSCISLSYDPYNAISIPFIHEGGDYFTPDQEMEVWKKLAQLLEDEGVQKTGQNLSFDSHFLLRRYGIKVKNIFDTMVAFHTFMPEYEKGLHMITSLYTDIPYYKEDGKFWLKGIGSFEKGWIYNAYDSIVCVEATPQLENDLKSQGNMVACKRQTDVILPLTYMQEYGIRADVEGIKKEIARSNDELSKLTEELKSVVGYDLNINSNQQLCRYFYEEKKYPEYKARRKDGSFTPAVDAVALKRLIRKGIPEAILIKKIRALNKRLSTYLELDFIDDDGRLRCAYNPSGTKFSRLSSSKSIFGKGVQQQNWPHDLQRFLLPDEGFVYYDVDLSQAENRMVAYVGNVTQQINAFEVGIDLHRLTAALIFGKPYAEISDEDGSSDIGNGEQSERFWGKKANHSLNYDEGYKAFALIYEIPESDAKIICDRYHMAYPNVRLGFHRQVQSMLNTNRIIINLLGRKTKLMDRWSDKLLKSGYSCIPQGSVGDIINEWGINYIYYNQQLFSAVRLLRQVHDSIGFQLPLSIPWSEHARILSLIKNSLEQELRWEDRTFRIPADFTMGLNLCKEDGIPVKSKNWPKTEDELATILENNYNKLRSTDGSSKEGG